MTIQLINCKIILQQVEYSTAPEIRRVTEYLEAQGPSNFHTIRKDLQMVGYALISDLAAARDTGLIHLDESGNYRVT